MCIHNLTWGPYRNLLKQEALDNGEFAMTNKATGEGVVVDAPFLSSIDVVQLAKRYREFCSVPETRKCPGSPDDYYLKGRECNGWIDCPDARDEDFDFCRDRGCGMKLNVEGSGHFDGIYELEEGYHNNRKQGIYAFANHHFRFNRLLPVTFREIFILLYQTILFYA